MMQNCCKEFEAVVMAAGKGSRMSEMTGRKPKCLLPIVNMPMVYFPLKMFEEAGFTEVFLVVLEVDKIVIELALEKTDLRVTIHMITIPADKDLGTADTLRYISRYLSRDLIVASCDLITDFKLIHLLNFYRAEDATIVALYFKKEKDSSYTSPGRVSKVAVENDEVGIIPETNQLVFVGCSSEFGETVQLPNSLIKKCRYMIFRSDLQDAHLYILKKCILNFLILDSHKDKSTLKGEVIPYIVSKQSSKHNRYEKVDNENKMDHVNAEVDSNKKEDDILFDICKPSEYDAMSRLMSSHTSNLDLRKTDVIPPLSCYAFIIEDEVPIIRTNTICDYALANRQILTKSWKKLRGLEEHNISDSAIIESTKIEKSSCFIGAETKVQTGTVIKLTSIGAKCVIMANARITNSILMDEVTVEERCILDNCIVCEKAHIESDCVLKNCIITNHHKIPSNSSYNKEVLTEQDDLIEI